MNNFNNLRRFGIGGAVRVKVCGHIPFFHLESASDADARFVNYLFTELLEHLAGFNAVFFCVGRDDEHIYTQGVLSLLDPEAFPTLFSGFALIPSGFGATTPNGPCAGFYIDPDTFDKVMEEVLGDELPPL